MKKILFAIGLQFNDEERTGVGEYYYNMLSAINFDVWLISNKKSFKNKQNVHCVYFSDFKYRIFRYLRYWLPITFFVKQRFDVYVSDGFIPIVPKNAKQYAFVHDLMHILYPNNYKKLVLWNFERFYRDVKRRNVSLITVSETTKNDLIRFKQIPNEKILLLSPITNLKITKLITEPFFVYIGAMRKNKNLLNTIKGFEEFKKYDKNNSYTLRIAGSKSREYECLKNYVDSHGLTESVQFLGYINEDEKKDLLRKCTALVFISLYEGFGLPILEAGLNNITVIASRISAFEEFTKDNMFFAEPENIQSIAEAFLKATDERHSQIMAEEFYRECRRYSPEKLKESVRKLFYGIAN